jgi:5-methylcytosine-specific restriction endonuclease McrA
VNPALLWPHPKSASLDHVVPLIDGGEHTYANVQLAHLACNVGKRDGGHPQQLALVG